MKLASFEIARSSSYGVITASGVIDIGRRAGAEFRTLRELIANNRWQSLVERHAAAAPDYALDELALLPPIPQPFNVVSCGGNFPSHIAEMQRAGMLKDPPAFPGFHIKTPGSLVGHRRPVIVPLASASLDYEAELAIVIGIGGRHIAESNAMDHILGYCCFNDGSVRDYQLGHSIGAGKNFTASGGFGPWIVTRDEAGDLTDRSLRTRVNGEVLQDEKIGTLVFGPAAMVAYMSTIMQLEPGDVITSGTPGGVGFFREPKRYLKAGDHLEIEVEGVCVLANPVVQERSVA